MVAWGSLCVPWPVEPEQHRGSLHPVAQQDRPWSLPRCVFTQAKANRGILYVDEVNLLEDGLVDVVLDSAASGINTVEREGISIVHPAKFIMIGSGNPQVGLHCLDVGKLPS